MPEPMFMKLGMYITALEPTSKVFINPSHQSVCLFEYPPTAASNGSVKDVTAATNTHAIIEELLDA
jgi:hypothetical protein